MTTFSSMIDTKRWTIFKQVICVWYLVKFYYKNKDKCKKIRDLIDLYDNINVIHSIYTTKLGLYIGKIEVGIQKINRSYLNTFRIVIVGYSVKNKLEMIWFFQKVFSLANICLEMHMKMFFLTVKKENIRFADQ